MATRTTDDVEGDGTHTVNALKIGELARRSKVSVRTLRFYDEIGLLLPGTRTEAGHRLYGPREIERLQQIISLRALGFSLDQVRDCLDTAGLSLQQTLEMHAVQLHEQIAQKQNLLDRLKAISRCLERTRAVDLDDLFDAMEMIRMTDNAFNAEQRAWIEHRRGVVGEQRIREVEAEWPQLMAEVRAEMERGTDPADPQVQQLMVRWRDLVAEFTGDNPEIAATLNKMYAENAGLRARVGMDDDLYAYVGKAMAAS